MKSYPNPAKISKYKRKCGNLKCHDNRNISKIEALRKGRILVFESVFLRFESCRAWPRKSLFDMALSLFLKSSPTPSTLVQRSFGPAGVDEVQVATDNVPKGTDLPFGPHHYPVSIRIEQIETVLQSNQMVVGVQCEEAGLRTPGE